MRQLAFITDQNLAFTVGYNMSDLSAAETLVNGNRNGTREPYTVQRYYGISSLVQENSNTVAVLYTGLPQCRCIPNRPILKAQRKTEYLCR